MYEADVPQTPLTTFLMLEAMYTGVMHILILHYKGCPCFQRSLDILPIVLSSRQTAECVKGYCVYAPQRSRKTKVLTHPEGLGIKVLIHLEVSETYRLILSSGK